MNHSNLFICFNLLTFLSEFVEICSEQGVQLLFFSVDPAGPQSEQWAWIELSERRSLEVSFQNENGPSLHVVYKDPLQEEAFNAGEMPNANDLSSPLFVVPEAKSSAQRAMTGLRSLTSRFVGLLQRVVCRPLVVKETATPSSDALGQSLDDGFRNTSFLTLLSQSTDRKPSWRRLTRIRFVEASFELVPVKDVAPAVFDVEPDLTGGTGATGRSGDWAHRDLTASHVPPSPSTSTPPVASAELEVDVAYLLDQAKADRNEQVALTRSAGGSLRVEGVVDTQQRKEEFLKALAPLL